MVNLEGASFSTFRNFPKRSFCDGDVVDGSCGINAICSRPEVVYDVISGRDVDTTGVTLSELASYYVQ